MTKKDKDIEIIVNTLRELLSDDEITISTKVEYYHDKNTNVRIRYSEITITSRKSFGAETGEENND